jgi:hypothetical protein
MECLGTLRRDKLIELNAPEQLIRHETDAQAIATELKRAPSGFWNDEAYIYDNGVESWLLVIADDEQADPTLCSPESD